MVAKGLIMYFDFLNMKFSETQGTTHFGFKLMFKLL